MNSNFNVNKENIDLLEKFKEEITNEIDKNILDLGEKKNMNDNNHKSTIILLGAILIISILNIGYSIFQMMDYGNRVNSGNERWHQVEERIIKLEEEVNNIK